MRLLATRQVTRSVGGATVIVGGAVLTVVVAAAAVVMPCLLAVMAMEVPK